MLAKTYLIFLMSLAYTLLQIGRWSGCQRGTESHSESSSEREACHGISPTQLESSHQYVRQHLLVQNSSVGTDMRVYEHRTFCHVFDDVKQDGRTVVSILSDVSFDLFDIERVTLVRFDADICRYWNNWRMPIRAWPPRIFALIMLDVIKAQIRFSLSNRFIKLREFLCVALTLPMPSQEKDHAIGWHQSRKPTFVDSSTRRTIASPVPILLMQPSRHVSWRWWHAVCPMLLRRVTPDGQEFKTSTIFYMNGYRPRPIIDPQRSIWRWRLRYGEHLASGSVSPFIGQSWAHQPMPN